MSAPPELRAEYPDELLELRRELARWRTGLFPFLAHGSLDHQRWLGEAIDAFANHDECPALVPDGGDDEP